MQADTVSPVEERDRVQPRNLTDEECWNLMLTEFGPGRSAELVGWMAMMLATGYRPRQTADPRRGG